MAEGVELATAYVSMALEGSTLKKQVATELDGIPREADRVGKQAGGRMSTAFKDSFKGVAAGLAAAFGTAQVIGFFKDAVSGAGNLQQSIGAVDTVFKGSSAQIHAWAKSAAQDVGLSRNEFNELGTLIGTQLKNGGTAMEDLGPKTKELISLGADLSSMFGGTTKDAVGALSSALKGERDPIEAYGVSLTQAKIDAEAAKLGFDKVGGSLSAEATQAATLSLIMKQTADAHGNFGKESDTLQGKQQRAAAQWENFKATLGEKFLPVITDVFSFINSTAIPALGDLGGVIRSTAKFLDDNKAKFAIAGAVITAIFLPAVVSMIAGLVASTAAMIASGVSAVATGAAYVAYAAIVNIIRTVTIAWTAAQWLLNVALAANPIALVVIAIAALVVGLILAWKKSETFRTVVTGAFNAVKGAAMSVWNWLKANWPLLLAIITGPIGLAVLAIVKNWDKIKAATTAVKNWIVAAFNTVVTFVKGLPGKISTAASGMWDGIKSAFRSAINWVIDKWNGLEFGIPAFTAFGKSFAGFTVGTPDIPRLAAGGIVTRPTLAWVGEGRESEAVLPLSRLESMLNGGGSDQPILMPDGTLFGWIRRIAGQQAQLVLNEQLFEAGVA